MEAESGRPIPVEAENGGPTPLKAENGARDTHRREKSELSIHCEAPVAWAGRPGSLRTRADTMRKLEEPGMRGAGGTGPPQRRAGRTGGL